MHITYQIIWLFLPAGLANMMAAISFFIFSKYNYPMDGNRKFRGKRILGDHKTWRGFIAGIISAELVFLLQIFFYSSSFFQAISLIDYRTAPWFLGGLIGCGALVGDAVKSFFKRQLSIPPGKSWFPFDQIDWVLGAIIFVSFFIKLSLIIIILTLVFGLIIHLLVKVVGYFLKVNEDLI